jgi:hypothetical protein
MFSTRGSILSGETALPNLNHFLLSLEGALFSLQALLLDKTIQCFEGKFLVTKFEFVGSFGMSLEGDCHEVEVTPNLEVLVTFGMSLEGVCDDLYK